MKKLIYFLTVTFLVVVIQFLLVHIDILEFFLVKYEKTVSLTTQLFAILIAALAAYSAIHIQRLNKLEKEVESALSCVEFWRGNDFLDISEPVTKILSKYHDKNDSLALLGTVGKRNSNEFVALSNYLREYEKVAMRINNKVYDENILFEQLSQVMLINYIRLRPFIDEVHKWFPGIFKHTVIVMDRWLEKTKKLVK
ncbi:TPA: hypothetical protein ACP5TT_004444 [Vibrio parahaemolyticus]